MFVEFREQAESILPDEPRCMFSAQVCAKPLLRCESSHSDVDTVSPGNPVQISFKEASFPIKHLWVQFNDI